MQNVAIKQEQPQQICFGMMKQKSSLRNSQPSKDTITSSNCRPSKESKKRIEKLFTRFAVFYGHLWRSQFKSEGFLEFAKSEWLSGLEQFSDEVLNKAILECRDLFEMPPSLPQLIGVCRSINKRNNFFIAPKQEQVFSKEKGLKNLRKCKTILSTEKGEQTC